MVMGFFDIVSGLLDENSSNSLENKLTNAIDAVEGTLGTVLEKAETGVQAASDAIDKLDATAKLAEEKISVVSDKATNGIDTLENKL